MNAKDFQLDYFQFYEIENPKVILRMSPSVKLQGQFDEEPEWARPYALKKFGNPASKNGEEYFDENAHLTWYNLNSSDARDIRCVTISNQFSEQQDLMLYDVVGLLAPARKSKLGRRFSPPTRLDHYKIYRVIEGDYVGRPITLEDQFQGRQAVVYYPVAFAVPVTKEHYGHTHLIHNAEAHLTIYRVSYARDRPDVIHARDQFGLHRHLKIGVSFLLAAPTKKVDWHDC